MPWTDITRRDYARKAARYASDLSDGEWALIAPLLPGPKPVGRPRVANLREVANAILYMVSTGCQWRMLPKDFPPFTTVQNYFYAWRDMGVLRAINNTLVMAAREQEGREASPTAGVIDSQSVKTTESGGIRAFDVGKNIQGPQTDHIDRATMIVLGLLVGTRGYAPTRSSGDIAGTKDGAPAMRLTSLLTRLAVLMRGQ